MSFRLQQFRLLLVYKVLLVDEKFPVRLQVFSHISRQILYTNDKKYKFLLFFTIYKGCRRNENFYLYTKWDTLNLVTVDEMGI